MKIMILTEKLNMVAEKFMMPPDANIKPSEKFRMLPNIDIMATEKFMMPPDVNIKPSEKFMRLPIMGIIAVEK